MTIQTGQRSRGRWREASRPAQRRALLLMPPTSDVGLVGCCVYLCCTFEKFRPILSVGPSFFAGAAPFFLYANALLGATNMRAIAIIGTALSWCMFVLRLWTAS